MKKLFLFIPFLFLSSPEPAKAVLAGNVTLNFSISRTCATNHHFDVTATLNEKGTIRRFTFPLDKDEIRVNPTNEEKQIACMVILKILGRQFESGDSLATVKSLIEGKTIDMTISQ